MSATIDPQGTAPPTLATAGLPPRVRRVLEKVLALLSVELETGLTATLTELEQELFRLADRAQSSSVESIYLQALRAVRYNRADLLPRLLQAVEARLATVRRRAAPVDGTVAPVDYRNLRLVEDEAMGELTRLNEIAGRQESRSPLPLQLLCQRFGVLAGSPAFETDRLPVGPRALCHALREATQVLHLDEGSRDLLYAVFDRHVMGRYGVFVEQLDQALAREGILPGLTYVPVRLQPRPVRDSRLEPAAGPAPARKPAANGAKPSKAPAAPAPAPTREAVRRAAVPGPQADPDAPYTGWPTLVEHAPTSAAIAEVQERDDSAAFATLQQLLAGRRQLIQKLGSGRADSAPANALSTGDVLGALDTLQRGSSGAGSTPSNLGDIKQVLLAQARQRHGRNAGLAPADNDTFELLGLLYRHLETEIRPDAPAAELIRRLQLPLLQVALRDRAFFVRPHHPAREMLNTVAEAAARWLGEDDFDPQLLAPLQEAVSHVVRHYDGDLRVFESGNRQLQGQLEAQARKAELLERRHVEAARGKERLEAAKRQAAHAVEGILGERTVPKFTRALLDQAWTDVLTLTLLRQGEESTDWQKLLDATGRMVDACVEGDGRADPALVALAERSLRQVGHHEDEAAAIALRLAGGRDDDDDDAATRTALAIKLKARSRLGSDTGKNGKPQLPPRTEAEQARYDQLRTLPFGTWFEFVLNQQGDVQRRRLSWYSTVSDHALFVNARGQRIADLSLDALARQVAAGQARIVTAARARLVDRAWNAAMGALRSLTGSPEPSAAGGAR